MLSPADAKRAVERYWLRYTVVWGVAAAVIMLGGFAERWRDVGLMTMGVLFAAGAVVPPLLAKNEHAVPWSERTAPKMIASVVGLAFGMNYLCTPYFFDVLHMHFGFATEWNIENNPFFLYLMTVAYFATYSVLLCVAHRAAKRLGPVWRWPAMAIAPFAVAFLETVLNANPFMRKLFCFDDVPFMLWFGTLSYGACFVVALPIWIRIDETPGKRTPWRHVIAWLAIALVTITITFALMRRFVAPHVTTVVTDPTGLRDGGCLNR